LLMNYDWYHTLAGVGLCPHTPKTIVVTTTKPHAICHLNKKAPSHVQAHLECRESHDATHLTTEAVQGAWRELEMRQTREEKNLRPCRLRA
jgi:hypothetical protein